MIWDPVHAAGAQSNPTERGKALYFLRWHFESDNLEQSSVPILRALPPKVALNLLIHMQVGLIQIGAVLGLQQGCTILFFALDTISVFFKT